MFGTFSLPVVEYDSTFCLHVHVVCCIKHAWTNVAAVVWLPH